MNVCCAATDVTIPNASSSTQLRIFFMRGIDARLKPSRYDDWRRRSRFRGCSAKALAERNTALLCRAEFLQQRHGARVRELDRRLETERIGAGRGRGSSS